MIKPSLRTFLLVVLGCLVFCADGVSQVDQPMKQTGKQLASTLRKAGRKKVAVVPLLFIKDTSGEQIARRNAELSAAKPIQPATPILSASKDSLRLAEEMQGFLAQASEGDFGVVPCEDLLERLNNAKGETDKLSPTSKELARILNPDGDIDALVVGTIQKQLQEQQHLNGGTILGPEKVACEWNVLDLSSRTILVSDAPPPEYPSLAAAVYDGLSAEYFRYQNGRLTCLLDYQQKDRATVPLLPSDSIVLYDKGLILTSRIHPLINPNCPFKVQFEVDKKNLPIQVAETSRFGESEIPPLAVINLEPGEEPVIRIANTLPQRVIVAVLIDGINILGKKRELPDESCHAWVLEANSNASFQSWWNIENKERIEQERFVIQDWSESVAGKIGLQGDADSSRSITVAFFTDGFAKADSLAFFERSWLQRASFTSGRQGINVSEGLVPPNSVGAAPNMFGMGAKKAVPGELNWATDAKVGTMLASMTVWYCPRSDTKRMFTQLVQKKFDPQTRPSAIVPIAAGRIVR